MPAFADQVHSLVRTRLALIQSNFSSLHSAQTDSCHHSEEHNTCPKYNICPSKMATLPAKTAKTSLFLKHSTVLRSPVLNLELLLPIWTLHLTHRPQLLSTRDPDVFLGSTDFSFPSSQLHDSVLRSSFHFQSVLQTWADWALPDPHPLPIGLKGPLRSTAAAQPRSSISIFNCISIWGEVERQRKLLFSCCWDFYACF